MLFVMNIPIFNTYISPKASEYVSRVLESTYLSEGVKVKEFESQLTSRLGWVNPIAVNSGTSALHLALVLAGIEAGDEVICPAQTFVATGLVVLQQKATVIFADIQYESGNIDPKSIEKKVTKKTKAIMPVHWGGAPCDMDEIGAIADAYDLTVVEDAAHATGATYKGRPVGSISQFTCFSFQAIKHITTGDGGAVCCLDKSDAEQAFVKRWFGIDRAHSQPSILGERQYDIASIGYKYHMNDYAAALGLANLEGFAERLARRRKIASYYRNALGSIDGIRPFITSSDRESAEWLFGMHVERRNDFIRALQSREVTASVVHLGIDHNSCFGERKRDLSNQDKFNETQVHIPIHDGLTDETVATVVAAVKAGW
jgi:perosamine synthetase